MNLSKDIVESLSQEYLIVNELFLIQEKSKGISKFSDRSLELKLGEDVRSGFPELIGLEAILKDIFLKQKLSFELQDICRSNPAKKTIYFNLYFILENYGKLIILFEDVTDKNFKYQQKVQAANECKLLADRISKNNNLQEILKSTKIVLLITDRFGIINHVSQATLELFNYSRSESIGQHISMLFNNNKLMFFNLIVHQNLEITCQTKTKKKLHMNFSSLSIYSQTEKPSDLIFFGQQIK